MLCFVSFLALVLSYFILPLCFFASFLFPLGLLLLLPCLHCIPSPDIPYRLPLPLLTYMVIVQNFFTNVSNCFFIRILLPCAGTYFCFLSSAGFDISTHFVDTVTVQTYP